MSAVFLSYSKKDHFFAELAKTKLGAADISVWVDRANLRAGDDWRQEIDRGIADCFAVVVALSSESVLSSYVTYEWASAIGKGKPIVPVLLDQCQRHPRLEPIQYLDFTNSSHQPWQQLIERLEEVKKSAEISASDVEVQTKQADLSATSVTPSTKEARAAEQILDYLNGRGFQMVSFERIREKVNKAYKDSFLEKVIAANSNMFRPATLKGGKRGMAKL